MSQEQLTVRGLITLLEYLPPDLLVQTCSIERPLDYLITTDLDASQTTIDAEQRGPRIFTTQIDLDSWRMGDK